MKKVYSIVQYEDYESNHYKILYTYASEDEAKDYLKEKAVCWDLEDGSCTEEESYDRRWLARGDATWGFISQTVY